MLPFYSGVRQDAQVANVGAIPPDPSIGQTLSTQARGVISWSGAVETM